MEFHRFIFVLIILFLLSSLRASPIIPRYRNGCYSQPGDIYLGALIRVTTRASTGMEMCSNRISGFFRLQYVEAFVYAINKVNERDDILPNITLGFILFDTCGLDLAALALSTHFLRYDGNNTNRPLTGTCINGPPEVPVAAVVGPATSREAVLVGALLSAFQVIIFPQKLIIISYGKM